MKPFKNFIIKFFATACFIGYVPNLPGTAATVFGLLLYRLVANLGPAYFFLTAGILILGFLVSGEAEKIFGKKDSKEIVIDEVAGALLTFFLIPPKMVYLLLGFLLFRFFDVVKPPPIKRLEGLGKGTGIMSDDILAAVYSNILLQVVLRFAS